MIGKLLKSSAVFFLFIFFIAFTHTSFAAESGGEYNPEEFALHHVADANEWRIVGNVVIPLPVIVYNSDWGWDFFMSNKLPLAADTIVQSTAGRTKLSNYHGYVMKKGRVATFDGSKFYDLSITKNVAVLLIVAMLLIFIFTSVAKAYKQREGKSPKGLQSLMEPLILFVRDDIVKSNLGSKTDKYFPYITTLFFFILFGNLLGLIPLIGNPNLTGNITITMALALMTFLLTNLHANKYYWKHIFWPPGIPFLVKLILVPIEILGIFIKPFALMIRLFANMTAGHIVIISLIGLIFIFGKAGANLGGGIGAAVVAVPFALFMSFLELLVAFLQAYIFAMLSAVFISLAQEEHHQEHVAEI